VSLRLDWCSHEAARYACRAWHYSRSVPTPPHVRVGVWEHEQYIGCVLFSRGANRHLGRPFGLEPTEIAELARIALRAHEAPVSRIIAVAVRLLRRQCPGLRLVVSFADPEQGHIGTIYQAAGWTYLGTTEPSRVFVDARGRRWHPRMVSARGVKRVYGRPRAVPRIADCTRLDVPGKHRYALALDAETRERLAPLAQPYPRRGQGAESGTLATSQRGRIDSTCPLHHDAGGAHV
jgi:hypothetical protein